MEPAGRDLATEETFSLTGAVAPSFARASQRMRFTACVAEFAEILRQSHHSRTNLEELAAVLEGCLDPARDDREQELRDLVRRAALLTALRGA